MTSSAWTRDDIPDLTGRVALVTGANSGLGLQTSIALAAKGAHVVLACRDQARGEEALGQVRVHAGGLPGEAGSAELRRLDLADLGSVRRAAAEIVAEHPRIDLLVNNAGVMAIPRRTTADGFEMQLGTNHLGHFALTGLLLPALLAADTDRPARVVSVSSIAHRGGRLNREDLMGEQRYRRWGAYSQSKLANLLFAYELQRRFDAADAPVMSLAAHPGFADTNLQHVAPAMVGSAALRAVGGAVTKVLNAVMAQPAEAGALPSLRAATDPGAVGGEFFGPDGVGETRGAPQRVAPRAQALDASDQAWLWQRSVELTGVDFGALGADWR